MPDESGALVESDKLDSREIIEGVIKKAAALIERNEGLCHIRWNRPVNRAFLNSRGYKQRDVEDIIYRLKVSQYMKTSVKEDSTDAYEFGVSDSGNQIYLKFSFSPDDRIEIIDVISFHEPERRITRFPYRKSRKA